MPRRKKNTPVAEVVAAQSEPLDATDVFDEVIDRARAASRAAESPPDDASPPGTNPDPEPKRWVEIAGGDEPVFTPSNGHTPRQKRPVRGDGTAVIALGPGNDGPKVRLLHYLPGHRYKIVFDEKPPEDVRAQMKEDGWAYGVQGDQAWSVSYREGEHHRAQTFAHRQFKAIGDELRRRNGLEPTLGTGEGR